MKTLSLILLCVAVFVGLVSGQTYSSGTARSAGEKMRVGDRAGAIAILTKAIDDGKDLYDAYLMRGDLRGMTGDIDGAIVDLTKVLEIDPASSETHRKRAMFRTFKRDYAGALKDLDAAMANTKFPARVLVERGHAKKDSGDSEGAINDFRAAISYQPTIAGAHIAIAEMEERLQHRDAAILVLKDFLDAFEGRHEGRQPTANVDLLGGGEPVRREPQGNKKIEEFIVSTETVKSRPSGGKPLSGDEEAARMEQMLNVAHAYTMMGRLYIAKDDGDKALENIEKGLKINPQDIYGYMLRSQVRWKRNDLAGVIEDLNRVVTSPMRSPGFHHDKAMLLTLQGKDVEAASEFALHRKTFPGYTEEKMNSDIERARKLRSAGKSSK
jgi:tetratricopeptide (TPR) repeat protein